MTRVIVKGSAAGRIMKTTRPINFLGAVDKRTGVVRDAEHDLYGRSVRDSILVFPHGAGSSVGAYTIHSLKSNNSAPRAMVCRKADLTVASGCALADIPLLIVEEQRFDSLRDGDRITLDDLRTDGAPTDPRTES